MALIQCTECGKDVSSQAISCPHCGYPAAESKVNPPTIHTPADQTKSSNSVAEGGKNPGKGCLWFVAVCFAILWLIGRFLGNDEQTGNSKPRLSKAEWRRSLSEQDQMFGLTGVLKMTEDELVNLVGVPDRTQSIGGKAFWYYDCTDGTIQVVADDGALRTQGVLIGRANDY